MLPAPTVLRTCTNSIVEEVQAAGVHGELDRLARADVGARRDARGLQRLAADERRDGLFLSSFIWTIFGQGCPIPG
jgi:hypothetical protein